jgi:hypothetical protein
MTSDSAMPNESVERGVVIAAVVVLLVVLAIESVAVVSTFRNPQTPHANARSLINAIIDRVN